MIQVQGFAFNAFSENTYLLYDESKECIIIDPGCYEAHEREKLIEFIEKGGLKPVRLLNTHCHIDHVLGNAWVKRQYNLDLEIPQGEEEGLLAVSSYASNYGFSAYEPATANRYLEKGEVIKFGNGSELKVLYVPGHSPAHMAFYAENERFVIGGDVLFQGSVGRTDLPGGDMATLIKSIHTEFFPLGDEVKVYCGHGPATQMGIEKKSNPFCALRN
ncbi:MAG: MBL fold metallo-hydrolase [Cyclobacteriaceae bacterium]|nr:MBL fold metallo-hydrolase [Cyclobacteriaceae bacterium]MCH8515527.1 MBL fold metallo-hydrolase [Cyclobacteriaceae bacterium]